MCNEHSLIAYYMYWAGEALEVQQLMVEADVALRKLRGLEIFKAPFSNKIGRL